MDTKDMLSKAIVKIQERVFPGLNDDRTFVSEPRSQLYPFLQVFDLPDQSTKDRVKFIYEYFMENGGNPKDQTISAYTKLASDPHKSVVDRVWKYCKLRDQSQKALGRYEAIWRDINALGTFGQQ